MSGPSSELETTSGLGTTPFLVALWYIFYDRAWKNYSFMLRVTVALVHKLRTTFTNMF
jgi:hypothetical protein